MALIGGSYRVLGVDPGLVRTGVACLSSGPELVTSYHAPPEGVRGPARLVWHADAMTDVLYDFLPNVIVIEGYSMGSVNRAFDIGELGGVFRLQFWRLRGAQVYEVPPSTMKKFVAGHGHADKVDVQMALFQDHGWDVRQEDEADAAGLAVMGKHLAVPSPGILRLHEAEALAKARTLRGPPPRVRRRG